MSKVGIIKNVSGCLNAKSASIYTNQGEYLIEEDGMFGTEVINLTLELASVSFERHTKTNKTGVAARTLAGGLAGTAYGKGHTGLTGALFFLGDSIGSTSESTFIALTMKDGDSLHGEADARTASLLASIAPNEYDARDKAQIDAQREQKNRFLKDAPRTYYEVKANVDQLRKKRDSFEDAKDNGKTFEDRENALKTYNAADQELSAQKELLSELELELKARNAGYDSHQDLYAKQLEVADKGYKLQQKVELPRVKFGLYVLSFGLFIHAFTLSEHEIGWFHIIAMAYFFGYTPFLLWWWFRRKKRKKLLAEIHAEFDKVDDDKLTIKPNKKAA